MAGANYMGGKKNAAKVRSRDAAGRQQKRFFGRQRLNLLSKRRSINSPTSRNQPQPSISLAHAKQNSTLPPQGYIPSPSKPPKSKRDGPSSASRSSKVLEALDTSEPMFLRAAMNQILSLPDLAGLYAYKKRIRVSDVSSPEARRSKRIKSELSPEKDEELSFGSQNNQLCDSPDASSRIPDSDEYDEEPDDTFFQARLSSYATSSKSSQLSPVLAPSQRTPHIPAPNDVAEATSSFGTLPVTSSLQTSFSGNIFDYEDPWTAVGVILGLQSAPSTPEKDADNTSALAEQPRPPVLARQRSRVRLTAYSSSDSSSEGIPVASSHSSDNFPPPPRVDEDDSYSQSGDFHFGEDDSDHDFEDDIPARVHQKLPPLHLESYTSSAYFSSSNDYFNALAREPVAHEEGKDLEALFDRNSLRDGSTFDCHSQPVIDEGEDYADSEDPDDYTLFETSSWAVLDAGQCIEELIPANHGSGSRSPLVEQWPSPVSLHKHDTITTETATAVSPLHRSSPSVAPRVNTNEDDLHFAQQVSPNASACSSRHSQVDKSLLAFHSLPANSSLCPLDDTQDDAYQLAALPISIRTDMPSSDTLARHPQVADDPESAFEFTSAPESTHETFSTDKTIHSAYSPAPICREVVAPQSFAGFCLFSRDDFLEEPDSDD